MKLFIDAGNTRLKWCWFDGEDLPLDFQSGEYEDFEEQGAALFVSKGHDTDEVVVCNVAGEELAQDLATVFEDWDLVPVFLSTTAQACGVTNAYKVPDQLGVDRWLAMLGAWSMIKDAVCVVDCGSAVTIDILGEDGVHLGGMIIPGLEMMQDALVDNTGITLDDDAPGQNTGSLLANDTASGVEAGTLYAIVALIDRVRQDIERELGVDIPVLISGGDVDLIQPLLAGDSQHEPMLVFHGMIALSDEDG